MHIKGMSSIYFRTCGFLSVPVGGFLGLLGRNRINTTFPCILCGAFLGLERGELGAKPKKPYAGTKLFDTSFIAV